MILKRQWCEGIYSPSALRHVNKTNDSEVGRMEAPARNASQAEAQISQHIENIKKYNDSDLPPAHPTQQAGAGEGPYPWGGGGPPIIYIYIYIFIHICMYTSSYIL